MPGPKKRRQPCGVRPSSQGTASGNRGTRGKRPQLPFQRRKLSPESLFWKSQDSPRVVFSVSLPFEQRPDPSAFLLKYFHHAAPAELLCPPARTVDHSSHRPPDSASFPDALVNLMHVTEGPGPSNFVIPKKAKIRRSGSEDQLRQLRASLRRSTTRTPPVWIPPLEEVRTPSWVQRRTSQKGRWSTTVMAPQTPPRRMSRSRPESTPRGTETSAAMARNEKALCQ